MAAREQLAGAAMREKLLDCDVIAAAGRQAHHQAKHNRRAAKRDAWRDEAECAHCTYFTVWARTDRSRNIVRVRSLRLHISVHACSRVTFRSGNVTRDSRVHSFFSIYWG